MLLLVNWTEINAVTEKKYLPSVQPEDSGGDSCLYAEKKKNHAHSGILCALLSIAVSAAAGIRSECALSR